MDCTRSLTVVGLTCLLCACSSSPAPRFEAGSNNFDAPAPRQALIEAEQQIGRNPSAAAGRLREISARYPGTKEAEDAQYLLGLAYETLGSTKEAITAYDAYVTAAPRGQWADASRRSRDRLRRQYEAAIPSDAAQASALETSRAAYEADPTSKEKALAFADVLWDTGNFESAGKIYIDIAKRDPDFAKSDHFKTRIEMKPSGATVLSPEEVSRRQAERNPIEVSNLNSFGAVRDSFTQVPRFFVVTGQILSRSDKVTRRVNLTITIYGFGNQIYDTDTIQMGDVNPGEMRPFSTRFSNFRELNSIDRVEYSVSFGR